MTVPNLGNKSEWVDLYPPESLKGFNSNGQVSVIAYVVYGLNLMPLLTAAIDIKHRLAQAIATTPTSRAYLAICEMSQPLWEDTVEQFDDILRLTVGPDIVELLSPEDEFAQYCIQQVLTMLLLEQQVPSIEYMVYRIGP